MRTISSAHNLSYVRHVQLGDLWSRALWVKKLRFVLYIELLILVFVFMYQSFDLRDSGKCY